MSHSKLCTLFVFVALSLFHTTVQGQPPTGQELHFHTKFMYEVSFKTDSTSDEVFEESAELLLNDSLSLFRSVNMGKQDSTLHVLWKERQGWFLSMEQLMSMPARLKFRVVKSVDSVYLFEDFNSPNVPHETSWYGAKQSMDWVLYEQTKEIEGFHCQKAILSLGGRVWTAWFTTDIPINDGPYKFSGLPGLIVEVEDQTGTWKMELTGHQSTVDSKVEFFNIPKHRINALSQQQFQDLKRYYRDHYFNLLLAKGSLEGVKPEVMRKQELYYKNRALKDNNWIELIP